MWLYLVLLILAAPVSAAETCGPITAALERGKPVVVEFGADSCAPCREMRPIMDGLKQTHSGEFTVVMINVKENRRCAAQWRVQLIPTQIFLDKHGREMGRHVGAISVDGILQNVRGRQ